MEAPKFSDWKALKKLTNGRVEAESAHARGTPWFVYNSTAQDYFRDAGRGFGSLLNEAAACEAISSLHVEYRTVLGVDIMGQGAPLQEIGCDSTIAVTLPLPSNSDEYDELRRSIAAGGVSLVEGDLFAKETMISLIQSIDTYLETDDAALGAITYRPVAGDGGYGTNPAAVAYMYEYVFLPLYTRLANRGFMLLSLKSFGRENFQDFCSAMKELDLVVDKHLIYDESRMQVCIQRAL